VRVALNAGLVGAPSSTRASTTASTAPSRATTTRICLTPSSCRAQSHCAPPLDTTPTTSTTPKLREKQLVAVVHNDLWLNTLDTVNAFDTANETTGAVHPDAVGMLYAWHAETCAEGCIDRTVYGTSRTATTSFFTHHLRFISLAAVIGAALPVAIWAKSRKSHLLSGAPLAGLLPVVMLHVSAPPGDAPA
jgi:hypothetical protein